MYEMDKGDIMVQDISRDLMLESQPEIQLTGDPPQHDCLEGIT
jgi:hypothetical protein